MRLCFVAGTAAELIKIYPLIIEAEERSHSWRVVFAGADPRGLIDQFKDFGLDSGNLIVPPNGGGRCWFVKAWFRSPRKLVPAESNLILIQGDGLAALTGAHWGRRLGLPVAHVEAGLRSGHLFSPFPEEIVRRLVSRRALIHLAPDDGAAENLRAIGRDHGVYVTGGNTLADTVRLVLQKHPLEEKNHNYGIATLRRAENIRRRGRWSFICQTLTKAARQRKIQLFLHPRARRKLDSDRARTANMTAAGISLEPAQPYSTFIRTLAQADLVITDGGAVQEECYYLGIPCLILRDTTERIEGIHTNGVLARFDPDIVEDFILHPERWRRPPATPSWSPSVLILDTLERVLFPSRVAADD